MEGNEKKRKRNIKVWLPLMCPLPVTQPITETCALTGNQTNDPLFHRQALNPLTKPDRAFLKLFKLQI